MMWLKRLFAAESGSILVMSAFALTAIMGMSGLAVEIGNGYTVKVRNQRIADMAALGAAIAYKSSQSATIATQVAKDIVSANGLSPTNSVTTVTVPATVNGMQAAKVEVTTAVPIKLASVLTSAASYNVTSSAAASLVTSSSPACITALSSTATYGITETGGTSISASGCAVKTNAGISLQSSSTTITATEVAAGKAIDGSSWITTTPTANNVKANQSTPAKDTAKDSVALKAALCQVNKLATTSDSDYSDGNTNCTSQMVAPDPLTASGAADWNLTYQDRSVSTLASYQTDNYSCDYVIPPGTYTIGKLTVGGGCKITFQGSSTLKFDSIDMSGNSMTVGDGPFTVVGSFGFNSGSTITIGNGTHSFGALSVTGGRTLILGNGNFNVIGTIGVSGGSWIKVGIAAGDAIKIGGAIDLTQNGGGNHLCFTANCESPAAVSGGFYVNGSILTTGGSQVIFPIAATHIINGNLSTGGDVIFGSGLYIINGNFTNGTGGALTGTDVTFVLKGAFTLGGGTSLNLKASSSGNYGVTDLLIATKSSAATAFTDGSTGNYVGLIYAPKSDFTLSGGASVVGSTNCLMFIINTITLTGGTTTSSTCKSYVGSTSGSGAVALLQ